MIQVDINPEKAIFELGLDECSNLVKAYEAMRDTFVNMNSYLINSYREN